MSGGDPWKDKDGFVGSHIYSEYSYLYHSFSNYGTVRKKRTKLHVISTPAAVGRRTPVFSFSPVFLEEVAKCSFIPNHS